MKCDVQDHEEQVFRGGEQLLRRDHPELVFEQTEDCLTAGGTFAFLKGLGYSGYFFHQQRLTPIDALPAMRSSIKRPYLNYVFLPKNARSARAA